MVALECLLLAHENLANRSNPLEREGSRACSQTGPKRLLIPSYMLM